MCVDILVHDLEVTNGQKGFDSVGSPSKNLSVASDSYLNSL